MAFDRRETTLLLVGDAIILIASLWAALFLRNLAFPSPGYFIENFIPFAPMFLLSLVVFYVTGLYEKQTRPIRRVMGSRILGAQAVTVAIAAILFFVLPLSIAPKTILALYLVVSVATEILWRFYRMNRELDESEREPAILLGSGSVVSEMFEEVKGNRRILLRFLSHTETIGLSEDDLIRVVDSGITAGARIIVLDTSDIVVMHSLSRLYDRLADSIMFLEFSALYEEIFDRVPLEHLDAAQLLDATSEKHVIYDGAKRVFDFILALFGAVIAVPFVIVAATALLIESGSPFFSHERIGKSGHVFSIWKLRSMLFNDAGDPELQKKNRVTAVGHLLRKTRIDELPQLWNVLKGDLSFIGPRPELPKIAEVYERDIPHYRMRHFITPGLSGWAQIHDYDAPRGAADVARTRRKLSYDLYYLKHRSFGLDLAIAVKTLRALLSFSGT